MSLTFRYPAIAFLFFLNLISCTTTQRISNSNLSSIYKSGSSTLHPEYVVYHVSDSVSQVHFKLQTKELLYRKKEDESGFMAIVKFSYRLVESFESPVIIDSSSTEVVDEGNGRSGKNIIGRFDINTADRKNCLLVISATDIYRDKSKMSYIRIRKSGNNSSQYFLLRHKDPELPLFRNYIDSSETVTIFCRGQDRLYCSYYDREFPLAPPPFSMYNPRPFDFHPDSVFSVTLKDGNSPDISLTKKGFYHFHADSSNRNGLTVYRFDDNFPELRSAEELIAPLRFLTTKKEYMDMLSHEDPKAAIDHFWLENASNPDRAKELIRSYYNRVEEANRFFTSYVEGWKTDRGMVYIIFGPPNIIYKTSNSESWIYGEENNFMSLNFNFVLVENPFTDNDFSLNRTPIYKNNWYRAVDSWRQGRVYTNN